MSTEYRCRTCERVLRLENGALWCQTLGCPMKGWPQGLEIVQPEAASPPVAGAQPTQEMLGGIIPICPICERGVNRPEIDEHVKLIRGIWYHGPCSRFEVHRLLTLIESVVK